MRGLTTTRIAILAAVLSCSTVQAQIKFETYEIGEWGSKLGQTSLVDIDEDGDLDLWTTNRTAPRLRFLRNDYPRSHHFRGFS